MAKVKVKTHSGAKKRFKITGNGKVKYQHTNKRGSHATQVLQITQTLLPSRSSFLICETLSVQRTKKFYVTA